jgi:hypothetical protein
MTCVQQIADDEASNEEEHGRPVGAVVTGLLVAALGYLIALAGGMASAPSAPSGLIGMGLVFAGLLLATLAAVAIWHSPLRPATKTAHRATLVVLVFALIVGRVLSQFEG